MSRWLVVKLDGEAPWPRCAACGARFPTLEHRNVHMGRDCLGEPRPIFRRLPRPWTPGR